jgi:hypothetical protein
MVVLKISVSSKLKIQSYNGTPMEIDAEFKDTVENIKIKASFVHSQIDPSVKNPLALESRLSLQPPRPQRHRNSPNAEPPERRGATAHHQANMLPTDLSSINSKKNQISELFK